MVGARLRSQPLGKLRQEDHKMEPSLGNLGRPLKFFKRGRGVGMYLSAKTLGSISNTGKRKEKRVEGPPSLLAQTCNPTILRS